MRKIGGKMKKRVLKGQVILHDIKKIDKKVNAGNWNKVVVNNKMVIEGSLGQ